MQALDVLPDSPLQPGGEVTHQFLAAGVQDFRSAAQHLCQLPYGRTTRRDDCRLVLREGRGTCSTKHALLAELAREQAIDVALTLGVYAMTERNTPGAGPVLEAYGLPYMLEAHCYIRYQGMRVDITRAGHTPSEPIDRFVHEETITPAQTGQYKVDLHQRLVRAWAAESDHSAGYTWEELWRIREACIAALSA